MPQISLRFLYSPFRLVAGNERAVFIDRVGSYPSASLPPKASRFRCPRPVASRQNSWLARRRMGDCQSTCGRQCVAKIDPLRLQMEMPTFSLLPLTATSVGACSSSPLLLDRYNPWGQPPTRLVSSVQTRP